MTLNRRDALRLAAATSALSLWGINSSAFAQDGVQHDQLRLAAVAGGFADVPLGNPDAPVTLIEYASPSCPHCMAFHTTVYPQFKTDYVDTGKVQFVLRPFMRNALDGAILILAETAGPEFYHEVIDTYFATYDSWASSSTPRDALLAIAIQLGFTEESFMAALANQEELNKLQAVRDQALNEFGLTGTPTFYLNGLQLGGGQSYDTLKAAIDPLVPADFVAPVAEPAAAAPAAPAETPAAETPAAPAETPAAPVSN